MTEHEHQRALDLIVRRGVEEIAARDLAWMGAHLAACPECAAYAEDFDQTGQWLRSIAVTAASSLVMATQSRVRDRALYLQEQRSRMFLIAISFCIGVMSSATSGWLWWRFGGWVAERLGLSPALVEPGIALFLLLPAIVIAGLMLAFPHHAMGQQWVAPWEREREGGMQ